MIKKKEKGFTLIELLAVIVILGLLMAIAIPSVTKYITQSRRKTLVKTVDSYITAVVNQVNDGDYHFSDSTKIFAIPIECVSLEKGGTDPFGNWYQANDAYWAYVLIQYNSENYNYIYGFTFKDDAGYGMYPTTSANIDAGGKQIRTGYDDLNKPNTGLATSFVSQDRWDGFNVNTSTELVILEAESEGITGDGKTTCTLCQKGSNYESVSSGSEIPEGGTYYVGVTSTIVGNYTGYTAKYVAGDKFPLTVNAGDVYVYGDYEYRYDRVWYYEWMDFATGINLYSNTFAGTLELTSGWGVRVLNSSKTSYGNMLSTINKKPVTSVVSTFVGTPVKTVSSISTNTTSMAGAFYECTSLTSAPSIPNSVINMPGAFWNCTSLVTAPTIPSGVKEMTDTFGSCTSLTGVVVINANPTAYDYVFSGTSNSIVLKGSSIMLDKLAATSTKGNVSY